MQQLSIFSNKENFIFRYSYSVKIICYVTTLHFLFDNLLQDLLQRVQNAAARLVLGLWPSDHVTPGLRKLHWLPIQQGIKFKIHVCVMMHSVSVNHCPSYISQLV